MLRVHRALSALLLGMLVVTLTGCPSNRRSNYTYSTNFPGAHPSFRYRNELGFRGPDSYRRYGRASYLYFDQEFLTDPPAYIVFIHTKGPHTQTNFKARINKGPAFNIREVKTFPTVPDIFLDGRAVPDACITYIKTMNDKDRGKARFLRIRPGQHHLHIDVDFTSYDVRDAPYDEFATDYQTNLQPFKHAITLRPGDAYMVITGALSGGSYHGETRFTGTRTFYIPRERMAPRISAKALPTAQAILDKWQASAHLEKPDALYEVGLRHLLAIGLPQDSAKGKAMIRRAAELGHGPALKMMGDMEHLLPAIGPDLDERIQMGKRAQAWYQKALDRGSRSAGEKMLPSLRIRSRKDKAVQAALLRVQKQVDALPKVPLGISQDDVVKAVKAYGPTPKPKRK